MRKILFWIGFVGLILFSAGPACGSVIGKEESEAARSERMRWWREARFGMFIHWGLYSIPAGEWEGKSRYAEWIRHRAEIPLETYDGLLDRFNPVEFDAEAWVRMAREAGMRYLVITSKHHDGFCLWPSGQTEFDVESTPFKRDILGELKSACDRNDIVFCLYYSIMDWHHPDYLPRRPWENNRSTEGADFSRYVSYMKAQLKELVDAYDPGVLWFDGEWEPTWTHELGVELDDYVRSLKPDIIINNRVDKGRKGMEGMTRDEVFRGDFGTPEQRIPDQGFPGVDWESCMTMNHHWGFNRRDHDFKSTTELVRKLVDIASKGGNFLLNVGPKPDGTFPEESVERLKQIGEWMEVNGAAIRGTQASPVGAMPWGRVTSAERNGGRLFLHVFDPPEDGKLEVPGVSAKSAALMAGGKVLTIRESGDGMVVELPPEPKSAAISTTIVIEKSTQR